MNRWRMFGVAMLVLAAGCNRGSKPAPTSDGAVEAQSFALSVSRIDRRFVTRDHFIAAIEMQLSGEPFAQAMGRDLGGYSRDYTCQESVCSPSMYADPTAPPDDAGNPSGRIDLAGFSSAIESYEYSKQPMNNIALESGAGTSLVFGPLFNPDHATGQAALAPLQAFLTKMASASNASGRVIVGAPPNGQPLGWPGFWPVLQPFASWDPTIRPTNESGCSLSSDDNPGKVGALVSDNYECDYTSLNLPNRDAQVDKTIGPGASGWAGWKEALWTLNYLQVMHDQREIAVTEVGEQLLDKVGFPGNIVGPSYMPGTYLGSSNIEGFQAGTFIQILDNQAAQWLFELSTRDGKTLSGFADLASALGYGVKSELDWFPESIKVTESDDDSGFPRPTGYAISSAKSELLDLAGMLGAFSSVYALTDRGNAVVGGSQAARAYFDGDPLPTQNQTPDGEPSLHDRALAMIRVSIVNMLRMHTTAGTLFADQASVSGGKPAAGTRLSSDVAAYTLLALRTARRALDSELTLYSNTTPDTASIPSPLDAFPVGDGVVFGARLDRMIANLCSAFYDKLTTDDGTAYAGWDLAHGVAGDRGTSLDGYSAGIRGLLTAYLATGATKYRARAERVWQRLESDFYDQGARVYRASQGDRSATVTFSARRFGLLQAALRDSYELIALLPGHDAMRAEIEDRVGRLNKLVLNGWDDRDEDQKIEWPDECAQLGQGPDGQPLGLGGLQLAERTLSGETGSLPDPAPDGSRVIATDREHDCVPEISAVGLPSALASSISFSLKPVTR